MRLENFTTKERVRPLFELSDSIWNANHMVVLALWRVNSISPQPELPRNSGNGGFRIPLGSSCLLAGPDSYLRSLYHSVRLFLTGTFRTGMIRSLTTLYPDTRQEHHPTAPHACELPPRQRPRRLRRPLPRRPRTRFLPRSTRPHSPNPHLGCWTIPANLPIARPPARPVPPVRMAQYPRF